MSIVRVIWQSSLFCSFLVLLPPLCAAAPDVAIAAQAPGRSELLKQLTSSSVNSLEIIDILKELQGQSDFDQVLTRCLREAAPPAQLNCARAIESPDTREVEYSQEAVDEMISLLVGLATPNAGTSEDAAQLPHFAAMALIELATASSIESDVLPYEHSPDREAVVGAVVEKLRTYRGETTPDLLAETTELIRVLQHLLPYPETGLTQWSNSDSPALQAAAARVLTHKEALIKTEKWRGPLMSERERALLQSLQFDKDAALHEPVTDEEDIVAKEQALTLTKEELVERMSNGDSAELPGWRYLKYLPQRPDFPEMLVHCLNQGSRDAKRLCLGLFNREDSVDWRKDAAPAIVPVLVGILRSTALNENIPVDDALFNLARSKPGEFQSREQKIEEPSEIAAMIEEEIFRQTAKASGELQNDLVKNVEIAKSLKTVARASFLLPFDKERVREAGGSPDILQRSVALAAVCVIPRHAQNGGLHPLSSDEEHFVRTFLGEQNSTLKKYAETCLDER